MANLTKNIGGGYNWQFGNLVAGVELDFEYFRSVGSQSVTGTFFVAGPTTHTATINSSIRTDWLFTARPRFGMAVSNWLFYGTGGLAVTQLKASWSYSDSNDLTKKESATASTTKAGWTIGGGMETALPGNWMIGGEYLYVRFNSVTGAGIIGSPAFTNTDVLNHTADLKSNIIRARFSRKF